MKRHQVSLCCNDQGEICTSVTHKDALLNLITLQKKKCNNSYRLTDLDDSLEERSPPQRQTDLLERFIDETGTSESPVNLDGLYLQLHLIQRLTVQKETVTNVKC